MKRSVQLRNVLFHQAHKHVKHNVDFWHVEAVKCEQHVFVHQVRKTLERCVLITQMKQQ